MADIRGYTVVTAAYWGFTLTDGALRMIVLLYFHSLGYSPFQLAALFLLYEIVGIVTNLFGGWIGSRFGLKVTLFSGLGLQIVALLGLSVLDPDWEKSVSIAFVLLAQGLSGVAKDLCKMSSKSAIKLLVDDGQHSILFKMVALLTGSKNALKGLGFFIGGVLLSSFGFVYSLWGMAAALALVLMACLSFFSSTLGRPNKKTKVMEILSKSWPINILSAARVFLFGARDVWFVVAVPVFLYKELNWEFAEVGSFLAFWIISYGLIQGTTPGIIKSSMDGLSHEIKAARLWIVILTFVTLMLALCIEVQQYGAWTLIVGLAIFGFCFAVNSSLHSYLILGLTGADKVALSVGFYYSANAAGRLIGTFLSGISYQWGGLSGSLYTSAALLVLATVLTFVLASLDRIRRQKLPEQNTPIVQ
ncbi:MAG: MFS transporter [Rhodospirillaceae bacterium]|nr:MFS transporter [Rhodospirillaceae bacterium]